MVVREPLAMKAAFGENPKSVYGKEGKRPKTRMATAATCARRSSRQRVPAKCANPDPEAPAAQPQARGARHGVTPRAAAQDARAPRGRHLTAIRLAKEFNLLATIEHRTEGYLIADEVRAAGSA